MEQWRFRNLSVTGEVWKLSSARVTRPQRHFDDNTNSGSQIKWENSDKLHLGNVQHAFTVEKNAVQAPC
jgi:hypothetical protein